LILYTRGRGHSQVSEVRSALVNPSGADVQGRGLQNDLLLHGLSGVVDHHTSCWSQASQTQIHVGRV